MIRILPEDDAPLDAACARVGTFDWIIFPAPTAWTCSWRLLRTGQDLRALAGVKLCVVGAATAERLAHYRLKVDLILPNSGRSRRQRDRRDG